MAITLPSVISPLGLLQPSQGTAVLAQGALPAGPGRSSLVDLDRAEDGDPTAARASGGVFGRLLDDARARDVQAQQSVEAFARSDDPGRLHETMVAVSKAEIALRTVAAVRNKLMDAYRDLQHV